MSSDVYLRFFVMALVLQLLFTLSPHYGSTIWSRASVVRRSRWFGSDHPMVTVFAETHNEKGAMTQNHPQRSILVGKTSTQALATSVVLGTIGVLGWVGVYFLCARATPTPFLGLPEERPLQAVKERV